MPDETETRDERAMRQWAEWLQFLRAGVPIPEWPGEVRSRPITLSSVRRSDSAS